jgi:glycosyltransferase involved in cell wall biosynthesis
MKVAIIIPAYNEEKRIGRTLEEYGKYFKNQDVEILVVINNTTDKTEEIVRIVANKYKKIKYLNFKQGGKGFAIIKGFKEALKKDFDLIGLVDADMATSPREFFKLIENIGDCDGLIASRYIKGAVVKPKQSLARIVVSRIFNFLIRFLFFMHYTDTQCGAKLFKRHAIEKVTDKIGMTHWAFDVELLYILRKYNFNVKEFPTVWADKEYSKLNFIHAGPRMALSVIRLRLIESSFERLLRPMKLIAKLGDWLINPYKR